MINRFLQFVVLPLWRAWNRLMQPEVRILTGGVAFYALFSVFPLLYLAITLLFALLPGELSGQLVSFIAATLKSALVPLNQKDLESLLMVTPHQITLRIGLSLILVLYTATAGAKAAIMSIRMIATGTSNFRAVRFHTTALLMTTLLVLLVWTLGVVQLVIASLAQASGGSEASDLAGMLAGAASKLWLTKWLASFLVFYTVLALSLRKQLDSGWAMVAGAAAGAAAWMAVTWAFQIYLNISPLNTIYGALASIIGAMIWMTASASSLLLGAALTAEWETLFKETRGAPQAGT